MSNFYRWFANEASKLTNYARAKKHAEREKRDALRRFEAEGKGKYPQEDMRKTVRLAFTLQVLKRNMVHERIAASADTEARFMSSIIDTQRELLVQAWHVHVARAIKRVGNDLDSYSVRKTWRELAGTYAVLCLVDGFDIVRENRDIGFMLGILDKEARATIIERLADPPAAP